MLAAIGFAAAHVRPAFDTRKGIAQIARRFHGRARTAFGIGTNLTNDLGYEPINIVLKMTECNGQPVAKVSDSPGKTISKDPGYLRYLRQVFGLEPEKT